MCGRGFHYLRFTLQTDGIWFWFCIVLVVVVVVLVVSWW